MASAVASSSTLTSNLSMDLDSRPVYSSASTSKPFRRDRPPEVITVEIAPAEFQSEMKMFLSGRAYKRSAKKPPRNKSAVEKLPRISEASSSKASFMTRSVSSRDGSSRPYTSQSSRSTPLPRPSVSAPTSPLPDLSSFASHSSLKSSDERSASTLKKKKLFPFKLPTSKDSSRHISPVRSPLEPEERTLEEELDEACALEQAIGQLPAHLKPAAAKRLGIEVDGPRKLKSSVCPSPVVGPGDVPLPFRSSSRLASAVASPRPQSPTSESASKQLSTQTSMTSVRRPSYSRVPSSALSPRPQSPANDSMLRQGSTNPSMISMGSTSTVRPGATSPFTGAPRPEHPLEREAREGMHSVSTRGMGSIDSSFGEAPSTASESFGTTFYSSSSDSEGEEDGLRSSGYSYASSQTSYGVSSPTDPEGRGHAATNGYPNPRSRVGVKGIPNAAPASATNHSPQPHHTHHTQQSGSSTVSHQSSRSGSSAAVRSFSRPFVRPQKSPDLDTSFTDPRPAPRPQSRIIPSIVGVADGQPLMQLAAIREDMHEPIDESLEFEPPATVSTIHHVRQSSGSRNFSRPRWSDPQDQTDASRRPSSEIFPTTTRIAAADRRSARPLSIAFEKMQPGFIVSAESAEAVILRIFESLNSFTDLYVAARLNKGFYKVFKKHELRLMKNALRNLSPPQWELREASPRSIIAAVEDDASEYTPTSYVQFHQRDMLVIKDLKLMLLKRCQSHLRRETVLALSERDPSKSVRVDDAFWRIWTFCTIFGSQPRKDQDLEYQLDWLRGGTDHHRNESIASQSTATAHSRAHSQCSRYASASFGQGNYGGLGVDELEDVVEIWRCLKALLRGLANRGRLSQARAHGVFDAQLAIPGDFDAEQVLLNEWVHWLCIQGLSTIADIAPHADNPNAQAFVVAKEMDWMHWKAPKPGQTRAGFLQQAIKSVREEKASTQKAFAKFADDLPLEERRKSRGMELAAQLRESERGFNLKRASAHEDREKGLGLWLAWSRKVESRTPPPVAQPRPPPNKPLPPPPSQPRQGRGSPPKTEDADTRPASQLLRSQSSNNSLSLFPPKLKPRTTPNGSTKTSPTSSPIRSRQNSIRQADSVERLRTMAIRQAQQAKLQEEREGTYNPRLSSCPET